MVRLSNPEVSFIRFAFKDQRRFLLLATGSSILLITIFKLLYPYPDFFSNSYSYINAAFIHADVDIWPIGYAKFLAAIHAITRSALFFNAVQYLLLQASAFIFYLTIRYFFSISTRTSWIIFAFFIFNPLN